MVLRERETLIFLRLQDKFNDKMKAAEIIHKYLAIEAAGL
jgi:hypothetical protein